MSFKQFLNEIKDEWEFHKRHPEMFLVWAVVAWATYTLAKEAL